MTIKNPHPLNPPSAITIEPVTKLERFDAR
jgi:hypothetical protein